MNDVIFVLSFAVLPGGKYLLRKALESISQVVNELGSSLYNQSLALSLSEKGKSRSLIASLDAPLILKVSHFARNLRRCALGFLEGSSELLPLHETYECRPKREVVILNCRANDGESNA